ncbi:hypothetical protein [Fusibacter sp. 3D3]|nr:hypothetical protein [Fusibacter sp. 3D3]GAU79207.1 hypothetical protein F3D3_3865 [Fusibacter sp. 3D3]
MNDIQLKCESLLDQFTVSEIVDALNKLYQCSIDVINESLSEVE